MPDPELQSFDPQQPTPQMLLWAYQRGIFPMIDLTCGRFDWYSPDPRAVLPLDSFRVRPSLDRVIRRRDFDIRSDRDFEAVIRACADRKREGAWINERLIRLYLDLHEAGSAHSVEAWREGQLVGGLCGIQIGGAFFGDTMFSVPSLGGTNSSKVCLVYLVRWMRHRGFEILDTQFRNEHLLQFGCEEIPREEYLNRLARAVDLPVTWGDFLPLPAPDNPTAGT